MPTKRNPVAREIMEAIADGAAMFWEAEPGAHFVVRRRSGPKRSRILHRVFGLAAARRCHQRILDIGVRALPIGATPPAGVATIEGRPQYDEGDEG